MSDLGVDIDDSLSDDSEKCQVNCGMPPKQGLSTETFNKGLRYYAEHDTKKFKVICESLLYLDEISHFLNHQQRKQFRLLMKQK